MVAWDLEVTAFWYSSDLSAASLYAVVLVTVDSGIGLGSLGTLSVTVWFGSCAVSAELNGKKACPSCEVAWWSGSIDAEAAEVCVE